MKQHLLSIDPGVSTGISLFTYEDETVPALAYARQFRGGAEALHAWLTEHWDTGFGSDGPADEWYGVGTFTVRGFYAYTEPHLSFGGWVDADLTVIVEKFNARNTRGFSYTTDALEPLRCEGVILGNGVPHTFVQPPQQYLVGGKDKADKKRRQHRFLKDVGFYRTGKDLDSPDADDFRSSAAHALGYLARTGHRPTHDLISDWVERNPA